MIVDVREPGQGYRSPIHVTRRRGGGVVVVQGDRKVFLSMSEAAELARVLDVVVVDSGRAA